MSLVSKISCVETVAATSITTDTIIQGFTTLMGLQRFIQIKGESGTHIREYSTSNFIANESMVISGTLPAANFEYRQSTPATYTIATGTAAEDVVELDFGSVAKRTLALHIDILTGNTTADTYGFYVYVSEDGVNWSSVYQTGGLTGTGPVGINDWRFATFRYLKVTAFDNDTTYSATLRIYFIQALEDADDKCISYSYVNSETLYTEYKVKIYNEDIMLIVFTNNATYRIVDIDYLSTNYTEVDST